jgi:hypothetical protein
MKCLVGLVEDIVVREDIVPARFANAIRLPLGTVVLDDAGR